MREILFRGKTQDGKWVEGNYVKAYDYGHVESIKHLIFSNSSYYGYDGYTNDEEVIPETVGQFTGLTDKNGKKVFEGDILVFCKGATYPYQIKWDGMGWKLYRSDGKRIKEAFECNEIHYVNISEVIGNIHDNPELFEEE